MRLSAAAEEPPGERARPPWHYPVPDELVVSPRLRLGVHASFDAAQTLESLLRSQLLSSCNAVQVFFGSPKVLSSFRRLSEADVSACAGLVEDYGWRVLVHHPYGSNFARSGPATLPSLSRLAAEVSQLRAILRDRPEAGAVVLHPGSACAVVPDPEERKRRARVRDKGLAYSPAERRRALANVAENLRALGDDALRFVAVENAAGERGKLCSTLEELGELAAALPSVRFCVDTAHASGAGYALSTRREARAFLAALDGAVGLRRVAAFHLNDSRVPLGAGADAHARVGRGSVWRDDMSGLCELLRQAGELQVALVGEGSVDAHTDVPLLRDLHAGERRA